MARYDPLADYLHKQQDGVVRLSFADIERIIGRELPVSAETQRAFWSNNGANNVMTRAWLAAGFRSEQVNLSERTVVFRKVREAGMSGFSEAQAPFKAEPEEALSTHPLFGWMKGTITIAPGVDLTEPADPDLAAYLDQKYGSDDPFA